VKEPCKSDFAANRPMACPGRATERVVTEPAGYFLSKCAVALGWPVHNTETTAFLWQRLSGKRWLMALWPSLSLRLQGAEIDFDPQVELIRKNQRPGFWLFPELSHQFLSLSSGSMCKLSLPTHNNYLIIRVRWSENYTSTYLEITQVSTCRSILNYICMFLIRHIIY